MPNVPITFACGLYDRMLALYTGEVKPQGIDLNFLAIDDPRQIFDRMGKNQEFDASEMSSSDFDHPPCRRPPRDGGDAGVPVAGVPPRLRHRQPQPREVAERPGRQAHRHAALYPDRRGDHPRHAQGRVRRRLFRLPLGAGRDQRRRHARRARSRWRSFRRLDRAECVRAASLSDLLARGDIQAIIGSGLPEVAEDQPGRRAAVPGLSTRSKCSPTGARACSRSCTSSRCGATPTSATRSSPRACSTR